MKIIEKYITRELLFPFLTVLSILVGLFVSFSIARLLAGAVTETLGMVAMLQLVMLKTIIALEVLIPISFYVSVIYGLSRMSRDQEMNILRSVGFSDYRVLYTVLLVAAPVGIMSGALSLYARPWAYAETYILNAQAEAELNANRFQAGRFYGSEKSGRVVFVQAKDNSGMRLEEVFHFIKKEGISEIVIAKEAIQRQQISLEQRPHIELFDGYIYRIAYPKDSDSAIQYEKMTYFTESEQSKWHRRKAAPTRMLWGSERTHDIAELQWRLSRPVATILLALIAVSFTRVSPRQNKSDKTFLIAATVFAIYYNLSGLAQTWVEQGIVAAIPGIWWLYLLLFIIAGLLLPGSRQKLFKR
ncbi:LPS export ABC transporter permease LptF [Nitrosomonas sp. Nm34]|uniref:LPS export ABC transporter permease LptF n=1 Tax=Nitrosomonas sp. Nm34 TaxID=1881055 RepID=UPI0008DEC828|nr:LPS export ABC transporter permease LptF [Nitrosomonas sp. Nm34]SFI51246.1 lipopolysaccharide export system permease protein [Nitrosomonas sp. Nm34]